jgi:iron complex transport system ATP-binding protein
VALELLERFGIGAFAERRFASLSSGERQRVLLARSLMADPALIVLDEPSAGLDLPGREELLDALAGLAADTDAPAAVLVTHHVEEIPEGFTHALVLRDGHVVTAGPLDTALTSESLSTAMGIAVVLDERDGRFSARRA